MTLTTEIKKLSSDEKYKIRQKKSLPIMNEFKDWLNKQSNSTGIIPKTSIYKAIRYFIKHFNKLKTFVDCGALAIDNNLAERSLRPIAVGRKNWLFLGNKNAAFSYEIFTSIVNTCKLNGIDSYDYLKDILDHLVNKDYDNLEELLPDKWLEKQIGYF